MAHVALNDLSVDFVIYQGSGRSLRKALLHVGTSGAISHDAQHRIVVKALDRVSLELKDGDRIALVGGNGAGKTTLLRVLAGIYEPTGGSIRVQGKVTPIFDLALGLDPDATGYDNIRTQGRYLGLTAAEINRLLPDIAEFTELGGYLDLPVRTYSAGMRFRLCFATATAVDTEVLLMDEWFAVSDSQFLEKAQRRAEAFVDRARILVVCSHMRDVLLRLCNKAALLDHGQIVAVGSVEDILAMHDGSGVLTSPQHAAS